MLNIKQLLQLHLLPDSTAVSVQDRSTTAISGATVSQKATSDIAIVSKESSLFTHIFNY
jgi:hypothetical protein